MVKNPGEYVQSKYDDAKDLVETILSDGVQEVSADSQTARNTLNRGNTPEEYQTFTVADDSVQEFNLSTDKLIQIHADRGVTSGIYLSSFNKLTTVAQEIDMTNEGSTDLTGTTGPDNNLNVSRDGNTGHLENRTGTQIEVDIIQTGR